MYLKSLEMYGFKSFAEKTRLDFMPGITTVIGPNGSGKSNIADCIRWILGEQSIKSLRGNKSEDIIFAGTQNRKSLGFAEASLVFDNQDGELPIEYGEVTVTRKIYRNGETGFFINKAPCRLKDIQELFMDTGIGKDGYSIIGQGKIDEILSNKSEDRRHIFEEAAGIVKYRARKSETEKKLENTKLNLLRINDIIAEIEANINPLKIQSEKAKKFLCLRDELKNIEIGLFVYNINEYKTKIQEIEENIEIFESQKNDEQNRFNDEQAKKEAIKEKVEKLIEEIERVQNLNFEFSNKKEQINSEIAVCNEKIANNIENSNRCNSDIEELHKKNDELKSEKEKKLSRKNDIFSNKERYAKELAEKEDELQKYSKNLSEKEIEIEEEKKKIELNTETRYETLNNKNIAINNLENINKQQKALNEQIQDTISDLDSARTQKDDFSKNFYEIEKNKNKLEKELTQIKSNIEENAKKLNEFDSKINEIYSEHKIKEAKCNFLIENEKEKEGYSKSVKNLMQAIQNSKELGKGVHGVLANLISVDEKYETAIEMSLGYSLQNIITDTEDEAKKLVNYLKENKLGRASFLPISSVKGQGIAKLNTTGINGYIGVASDLVKTDKKYQEIIFNLLGRTVIVENMDSAINLARKNQYGFKIVTLEGDIINPSGMISGGSSTNTKNTNILGREKEIKKLQAELLKLKEKIQKLEKEKAEFQNISSDALEKFNQKQKEYQEFEITYATEKQKNDNIDFEILKYDAKLAKLREDVKKLENDKKENIELQNKFDLQMKEIDEENDKLNNIVSEFMNKNKDTQKYIDDLNFNITNLKISVSSFDEGEASINEIVERIEKEIENNINSENAKNKLIEDLETENKNLENKIIELKQSITDLENEVINSNSTVENLKNERILENQKLFDIEKNIEEKTIIIEDLKNQISKLELKKSKIDLEKNQIIDKMWEEYEITPNAVTNQEPIKNPQSVQKQVNQLRSEIRDLGSVDLDSIQRYAQMKERYDFLSEQRYDLEDTMAKLKKVISEMTSQMEKQFSNQFKIINQNFSKVFKELFGGGEAKLILTDESNVLECGIEINVQPPGKKLQSMSLLSGGERAFTAIALLFAILKINPSPFCVLDEIEAALDDVNVYRFAEYLKKFCQDVQFLVITHRKGTMEAANTVYGITMEEKGISKLLSMKL